MTNTLFSSYTLSPKSKHQLKQQAVDQIISMARSQGSREKVSFFYGILSPFMQKSVPLQSLEDLRKGCLDYLHRGGKVIAFIKVSRKKI